MKPRTTIILIAVLAVCVAFVVVRKTDWFKPDPIEDQEADKLFVQTPAEAAEVSIVSGDDGAERMAFRKADGKWRMVEPIDAPADKYRVDSVCSMFKSLKPTRVVKAGDEDYSDQINALGNPRWTVTLKDTAGNSFVLAIGRDLPRVGSAAASAYIRTGQGDIARTFVVAEDFGGTLQRPISDFRSKSVLELDKGRIVSLAVIGPRSFQLIRREGQWGFDEPVSALADQAKVKDLLGKVARVTAEEFVDDAPADLAPYGLAPAALTVSIEVKPAASVNDAATKPAIAPAEPNKRHLLLLGRKSNEKVFAKLSGEKFVFTLSESMLTDLQPQLIDLRDKTVLPVNTGEVSRVELELPSGAASLAWMDNQWRMLHPYKGKADQAAVKQLIESVSSLKASDFLDKPGAVASGGLATPVGRITLSLAGQGRSASLLIGASSPSGEKTFVMDAGSASVGVVATKAVKKLLVQPANLWDANLLALDSANGEKVTSLSVSRSGVDTVGLSRSGRQWALTAPLDAPADRDNLFKLLDRLEILSATKVVALGPEIPSKYADAPGRVTVDFVTQTPAPAPAGTSPSTSAATAPAAATKPAPTVKRYRLCVVKTGGHAYAWIVGGEVTAIGQFTTGLYDKFTAELRDRAVWKIRPDDVSRIVVETPKGALELQSSADGDNKKWALAGDRFVTIAPEKVTAFLEGIKELHAERFVSHADAPDLKAFGLDKPAVTVKISESQAAVRSIIVSATGESGSTGRYAAVAGAAGVFILPSDKLGALVKTLDDFKASGD